MNSPTIQNVVSTANLMVNPLDLILIARKAINIEYNPGRFVAAIIRIQSIYAFKTKIFI
jgi:TATA-box binding protein (TBP) (component of TFIID and TFIIIB)